MDCHDLLVTIFKLPHTKCSKAGEVIYCAVQEGPINPIFELKSHLVINTLPANGHLFTYAHSGSHCPLTKHTFLNHINTVGSTLCLNSLKGHRVQIDGRVSFARTALQHHQINGALVQQTCSCFICASMWSSWPPACRAALCWIHSHITLSLGKSIFLLKAS